MRLLQCLGVLDQNSVLRRHPCARHDGGGRSQPQRAGAGDDEDRHGVDDSGLERVAGQPPSQQSGQRQHQHHRHEYRANLIHQPLDGRLGSLGVFHQANDAGQYGVHPHSGDLQHDATLTVDRAPGEFVAQVFAHGKWLASEHGLIRLGRALLQCAVHGKAFAGLDCNAVAYQHISHGHIHFAITPQPVRHVWPQGVQCSDGGRGLALGPGLQPFAQQDEGDDHR